MEGTFSKKANTIQVEPFPLEYLKEDNVGLHERDKEMGKIMKNRKLCGVVVKYLQFLGSMEERTVRDIQFSLGLLEKKESTDIKTYLRELEENSLAHLNTLKKEFATDVNTKKDISKKLVTLKNKVIKKLKSAKRWRKAFDSGFDVVLIVVPFISLVAHPFVAPIIGSMLAIIGKLSDSFWERKEKGLERQKKVISSMEPNNLAEIQDLGLIDQVEEKLKLLLQPKDLAVTKEETMEKSFELENTIRGLLNQAENHCSNIRNAKEAFMKSMLNIKEDS